MKNVENVVLFSVVLSLVLVACGGGSTSSDPALVADESLEVTEWDFSNQAVTHEGEEIPSIDPAVDNGLFSIYLTVRSVTGQYWFTAYLSNDNRISGSDIVLSDDVESCLQSDCLSTAFDCGFTYDNILTCGTEARDLTTWLTEIPKVGYVIAEICDSPVADDDCIVKTQKVQFN